MTMTKQRTKIPKTVQDQVLKEYNHRCAICGADNPQLHHIDEDPANHESMNLMPLCPNHHLIDQHDPTKAIDKRILALFREYKDPYILKPQFYALFLRLKWLDHIDQYVWEQVEDHACELVDFVGELEMGKFYCKRIDELASGKPIDQFEAHDEDTLEEDGSELHQLYQSRVHERRNKIYQLAIELLRFQKW